jgi:HAD superfamily hydrolase (TIGR01509 family)
MAGSGRDAAHRLVIVWDLGGVVAHYRPGRRLAELATVTGWDEAAIDQALWGSGLDGSAELGAFDAEETWQRSIAALGGRVDRDQLRRCWALGFEPNTQVLELIDELGEPAALLSNNGPIVEACLDHELNAVGDRFAHRLLSWRLSATKPSPEAFSRASLMLQARPRDLVLVDDRLDNVAAATHAGWSAVHFTDLAVLRRDLDRCGRLGRPQRAEGHAVLGAQHDRSAALEQTHATSRDRFVDVGQSSRYPRGLRRRSSEREPDSTRDIPASTRHSPAGREPQTYVSRLADI